MIFDTQDPSIHSSNPSIHLVQSNVVLTFFPYFVPTREWIASLLFQPLGMTSTCWSRTCKENQWTSSEHELLPTLSTSSVARHRNFSTCSGKDDQWTSSEHAIDIAHVQEF
jgi:hypothetical protein